MMSLMRAGFGVMVAAALIGSRVDAKEIVWDGEGTGGDGTTNWNNNVNWVGDATFANNDDVVFYTGTPTQFNMGLGGRRTVNSITFNADADSGIRIYGSDSQGLTIAGGGINVAAGADGHHVIDAVVTNSANQTWAIETTTGSLRMNRAVVQRGGLWTITKTGDGLLLLGGNVQTRLFDIQAGTVKAVGGSGRFHDSDTQLNIAAGATMDYDNLGSDMLRSISGAGTIANMNGYVGLRPYGSEVTVFSGQIQNGTSGASLLLQHDSRATLAYLAEATGTQKMVSALSYSGYTEVANASLVLGGADGSVQSTGDIRIGRNDRASRTARLILDNTDGNKNDRLNTSAGILFRAGSELVMIGNDTVASSQTTGSWTNNSGRAVITLQPGAGGATVLAMGSDDKGSIVRNGLNGTLTTFLFRSPNLGADAAAGVGQIVDGASIVFDGFVLSNAGAGDEIGVLPWAAGSADADIDLQGLVTYGSNGIRLLDTATEFSAAIAVGKNVRLTGNATVSADTPIRALQLESAGATLAIDHGMTLTVQSGAIAVPVGMTHTISGGTLNFGNNASVGYNGYIHNAGHLTLDTLLTGNGANITSLSFSGPGTTVLNRSYGAGISNTTVIGRGTLEVAASANLATGAMFLDQGHLKINDGLSVVTGGIRGYGDSTVTVGAGSTLRIDNRHGAAWFYDGLIAGPSDAVLIKTGGNTQTLRNENTFAGRVIIDGGPLTLGERWGSFRFAQSIVVTNNGTFTMENGTGSNSQNNNDRLPNSAPLVMAGGSFVINGSANANHAENMGPLIFQSGRSIITLRTNTTSTANTVIMTADYFERQNNASVFIRGDMLGASTGSSYTRLRSENNAGINLPLSHAYAAGSVTMGVIPWMYGDYIYNGTGKDLVTYDDAGGAADVGFRTLAASEYNWLTANVGGGQNLPVLDGNMYITNITTDVRLTQDTTLQGLVTDTQNAAGDIELQGYRLTIQSGVWLNLGVADLQVNSGTGGSVTFGNNDAVGYQGNFHVVRRLEIRAPITDNGANAVDIVKSGSANLGLYNQNTYTGSTTINEGEIFVQNSGTAGGDILPAGTDVILNYRNARLNIYNSTQTVASVSGPGIVDATHPSAPALLKIRPADASKVAVLDGFITNRASVLSLVKQGPGAQVLAGANAYTGTTTVEGGTLGLRGKIAQPPASAITVGAAGALALSVDAAGVDHWTLADINAMWTGTPIAGVTLDPDSRIGIDTAPGDVLYATAQSTRGLVKLGAHALVLTGNNTYAGGTTIHEGMLVLGMGGTDGTAGLGGIEIAGATAMLAFNRSDAYTPVNVLSGAGGVAQVGLGSTLLDQANTFDGTINVMTGMLVAAHNSALGSAAGGTVVDAGATLGLQGGVTVTGETLTLYGFGATTAMGGLRNISGNNEWAGTIVAPGASDRAILSASGFLLISGNVENTGTGGNLLLRGDGDGEISGVISGSRSVFLSNVGSTVTGTWTLSGDNTYNASTTIAGGVLQISKDANLGATPASYVANRLNIRGGTLRATDDMALDVNRGITMGTLGGGIDAAAGKTLTVNSIVAGVAGNPLVKLGDGTVKFEAANTYAGTTTVQAGLLVVNNTHIGGANYFIEDGGTLGGSGVISGNEVLVKSGGAIAPGNSIGTLTVNDLRLDDGAILSMELSDSGNTSDRITLTGNLFAGNNVGDYYYFDFLGTGWHDGVNDTVYTLLTFGSGANIDGIQADKFKVGNLGGTLTGEIAVSDTDITLTVIPEPASLGTLGMIALAALLRRRLRR